MWRSRRLATVKWKEDEQSKNKTRRDKTRKSEFYAYEMEQITEFIVIAWACLCWLTYI